MKILLNYLGENIPPDVDPGYSLCWGHGVCVMPDKEEEGGDGGEVEQHHHQHNHQDQAGAGVHSPIIMVTLVPDTDTLSDM